MLINMDQTESSEFIGQNGPVTNLAAKIEQVVDTTVAETPDNKLPKTNPTTGQCADEDSNSEVDDRKKDQYRIDCADKRSKILKESVFDAVVVAEDQELAKRQYVEDDNDDSDDTFDEKDARRPKNKRLATSSSVTLLQYTDSLQKQDENNENSSSHDRTNYQSNGNYVDNTANHLDRNLSNDGASDDFMLPQNNNDNHYDSRSHRHSDEPEQLRKLFIGGLDYKTSEETLKKHFDKFGEVTDCVVMREQVSKRSRGFGFVIYASSSMVDRAQKARPHEVDGREVQSKRAISREDSGKPEAQATVKKVYLGGLSDDIEESELRDYFKEFGNIININIVAHKDTGKRRGFAFVEFDDYDPVDKIVSKKFHTIKDKRVEAKKAIPKVEMDARKRVDPRASMAGPMMALSTGGGGGLSPTALDGHTRGGRLSVRSATAGPGFLWDSPYGPSMHHGYSTATIDAYPPHYHSASAHYGADWMMHSGGGQAGSSPYGIRGSHSASAYGRSGYSSHAAAVAAGAWQDYGGFASAVGPQNGAPGPMRHLASYPHRSYRPYASGGGYGSPVPRGSRGYNP